MSDSYSGEGSQGFWNKFLSLFDKGKEEVVRSSKTGKARLDMASLRRERERTLSSLGEEVFKRSRQNKKTLDGLDAYFTEIEIIDFKIAALEREIKGLAEIVGKEGQGKSPAPAERERRPRHGAERKKHAVPEGTNEGGTEQGKRHRKRFHRPRRKPAESGGKPAGNTNTGL